MTILDVRPSEMVGDYVNRCVALGIDRGRLETNIRESLAYLTGTKRDRQQARAGRELELRWYQSLKDGSPDWSVYNDEFYMAELWACWVVYSRPYLLSLISPKGNRSGKSILAQIGNCQRVVDLGCGAGLTTAALSGIFPGAKVFGTNLEATIQFEFARILGVEYNYRMVYLHQIVSPVDLVFASEYFEHFQEPVEHLLEVLRDLQPRYMVIANTFTSPSIGHFPQYKVLGRMVPGLEASKIFNNTLRGKGYRKIQTNFWNNRPAVWGLMG